VEAGFVSSLAAQLGFSTALKPVPQGPVKPAERSQTRLTASTLE